MTKKKIKTLYEHNMEALEKFMKLPLEERLNRLKKMGILDKDGNLSKKYGGSDYHQLQERRLNEITD